MATIYTYSFLSALIVSLISIAGVLSLSLKKELLQKMVFVLISLAAGALLGDAFIHIIPESFAGFSDQNTAGALVIAGIVLFFIVEKFLHWHHHGEDKDSHIHPVGKLTLFSDGIHNLIDGLIIGASFMTSVPLGIATTIAVILHEIPQEIGDFAVLLHAGYTRSRALLLNFISAVMAFAGVLIALLVGENVSSATVWFLPVAAGGFIYVAVADLIPELQKTKGLKNSALQLLSLVFGVAAMLALTLFK